MMLYSGIHSDGMLDLVCIKTICAEVNNTMSHAFPIFVNGGNTLHHCAKGNEQHWHQFDLKKTSEMTPQHAPFCGT